MQSIAEAYEQIHEHEGLDRLAEMPDRLSKAADRLAVSRADPGKQNRSGSYILRNEQQNIFEDVEDFFRDVASRPDAERSPFARIILPPRTGKTIVAGFVIRFAKLHSLFVVPTKILVPQTVDKLRKILTGVQIGSYCEDEKRLVKNGVNVITYSSLQQLWRDKNSLPMEIAEAALIFVDEAHHAITSLRHNILENGFDGKAIRIALTATPDYNSLRTLNRFYPELIHEITLLEAIEMNLLAPTRFWVAEVDQDASRVSIVDGDYDNDTISTLMTAAPFLEAAKMFRYSTENAKKPALITCRSRKQAYELRRYMEEFRPKGTSVPQVILGETDKKERQRILRQYEIGYYDTLITVGVLIEGWDSPICKLLIDLAPSISKVRSTQKFCRVMTKKNSEEAHIYCIVPVNLCRQPLYPIDILGYSVDVYDTGDLLDPIELKRKQTSVKPVADASTRTKVRDVTLVHRIVASVRVEKPRLKKGDVEGVHNILTGHVSFTRDRTWGYFQFMRLGFNHPLFIGTGKQLLNYLGIPRSREVYQMFLEQVLDIQFPDGHNSLLYKPLKASLIACGQESVYSLIQKHFAEPLTKQKFASRGQDGWRALGGRPEPERTPEEIYADNEEAFLIAEMIPGTLTPMERKITYWRFGLNDHPEQTCKEIGEGYNLSRERIRQMGEQAFEKLRWHIQHKEDAAELIYKDALHERMRQENRRHNKALPKNFVIKRRPEDPKILDPKTFKVVGFYSLLYRVKIHYRKR
jgi:superfamily II DNA or RNA helicase